MNTSEQSVACSLSRAHRRRAIDRQFASTAAAASARTTTRKLIFSCTGHKVYVLLDFRADQLFNYKDITSFCIFLFQANKLVHILCSLSPSSSLSGGPSEMSSKFTFVRLLFFRARRRKGSESFLNCYLRIRNNLANNGTSG